MKYNSPQEKMGAHNRRKFNGLVQTAARMVLQVDINNGCDGKIAWKAYHNYYLRDLPPYVQYALDNGCRRINAPRKAATLYMSEDFEIPTSPNQSK